MAHFLELEQITYMPDTDDQQQFNEGRPEQPEGEPATGAGAQSALPPLVAGTLYLVATPIGNLEDITLRALRILRECDVVAAEDTRHSGQLLRHFGISKPLLSYFQFNEAKRSEEILERLQRGEKVALVTDAGSPGISDPGERVVKAALGGGAAGGGGAGGLRAGGGFDSERTARRRNSILSAFCRTNPGSGRKRLESLRRRPGTLIFYESPYRVVKLLGELARGLSGTARCAGPGVVKEI